MLLYAENDPLILDAINEEKLLENPKVVLGKT